MIDKSLNWGRNIITQFALGLPEGASILDIGAGSGSDLLNVRANNPTALLNGIECYSEYQERLRAKGIAVFSLDIEKDRLPFEDESFDLIVCNQIFEHLKQIWWVMHEISRVLKVGGRLVIGIPNLASFHNRCLLLVGKQPTCNQNDGAHVRAYTKGDLIHFIVDVSGEMYQLEGYKGSNFYPLPPFLAKPLARLFPSLAVANFYRFRKVKKGPSGYLDYLKQHPLETNYFVGSDD